MLARLREIVRSSVISAAAGSQPLTIRDWIEATDYSHAVLLQYKGSEHHASDQQRQPRAGGLVATASIPTGQATLMASGEPSYRTCR